MERAKKIITELKQRKLPTTNQDVLNVLREYLQTLVLKTVFQSPWGGSLSIMGRTALRICHDSKRYSEDLDFCLDDKKLPYRFANLMGLLVRELKLRGFDVDSSLQENKIVQKGFLRFAGLGLALDLKGFQEDQKLHVKLEVDVKPLPLKKGERESFFVNRFQEIFPILKHNLPTMFAGKVLALLHRPYSRGRDYYDLIWYLSQKTQLNLSYLNRGIKGKNFRHAREVMKAIEHQVKKTAASDILKDVGRFLADPSEQQWLLDYEKVFRQLALSSS